MRPLVLSPDDIIEMTIIDPDSKVHITADGQSGLELYNGDIIKITRSIDKTILIFPKDYSFYSIVRSKLNWGK